MKKQSDISFAKAAKDVALGTHIADLNHRKEQPKELSLQYEDEMKQLYLLEYPDYVRQYYRERLCCDCCCCYSPRLCYTSYCSFDPERTKDTWDLFKKVFPPYMFYFLVFTGAISSKNRVYDGFLRTFWFLVGTAFTTLGATYFVLLFQTLMCNIDANCLVSGNLESTNTMRIICTGFASIIPVFTVPTYLRDRFRSRELQTLISCIGPLRAGRPRRGW